MEIETSEFNQTCEDSKSTCETSTDQQDQQKPVQNIVSCLEMADYQDPKQDTK